MEKIQKFDGRITHLAGIVPVAAPPLEFNFPWHDCMMPIAPDYLAVERAVMECVHAGCSTVWIICHMGIQPLLRSRIRDMVLVRPKSLKRENKQAEDRVNVFYIPIHPKDKLKRDSLGWSALYGADRAFRICSFISKWIAPERYYCAFPYGVSCINFIKENKINFKLAKKIILSYNGKTIKDGIHTSFTFDAEDFKKCRDNIKDLNIKSWSGDKDNIYASHYKKLRQLSLEQIFSPLDFSNSEKLEIPWFYDISSWEGYTNYISSNIKLESPREYFLKFTRDKIESSVLNDEEAND